MKSISPEKRNSVCASGLVKLAGPKIEGRGAEGEKKRRSSLTDSDHCNIGVSKI